MEVETVAATPKGTDGETRICQAVRYAWDSLLARIYDRRKSLWDEVFPLQCPKCGGEMRIIAFIIETQLVRKILAYLGEPTSPPRMAPARGPPLWGAVMAGQSSNDPLAQPEPAYEFDQRIAWYVWASAAASCLDGLVMDACACDNQNGQVPPF